MQSSRLRRTTRVVMVSVALGGCAGTASAAGYSFRPVADNQGQFGSFFRPTINASGAVAFTARLDGVVSPPQGVYVHSGGVVSTVAETGTTFRSFGEPTI